MSSNLNCVICAGSIDPGERRVWDGSQTVHENCADTPVSPLPQFAEAIYPDELRIQHEDFACLGTVVGKGFVKEPVTGYEVYLELKEWEDLPTDQAKLIHRRGRTSSWRGVRLYINDLEYDDEAEHFTDNYVDYGKPANVELIKNDGSRGD
jgi:hypothetical protein